MCSPEHVAKIINCVRTRKHFKQDKSLFARFIDLGQKTVHSPLVFLIFLPMVTTFFVLLNTRKNHVPLDSNFHALSFVPLKSNSYICANK
jgi:hypothetical protein